MEFHLSERVQKLADKLQAKNGETYNKIQYKLWGEAMDVNKHRSMERPPGTIWGTHKESKRAQSTSEAMSEASTNMVTTLVTAFNKPTSPPGLSSPISNKSISSIQSEAGVSQVSLQIYREIFSLTLSNSTSCSIVVH